MFSQIKDINISNGIFIPLVMPQGWDLGVLGGQNFNFSEHGHVAGWWVEQNTSKTFTLESNLWPCGGVKRSNIIKFQLQSQFQRFLYQTLVCVLTNKRYKTYRTQFSFCCLGHASGVGLGVLVVKIFSVGICDGAPLTAHSSVSLGQFILQYYCNQISLHDMQQCSDLRQNKDFFTITSAEVH